MPILPLRHPAETAIKKSCWPVLFTVAALGLLPCESHAIKADGTTKTTSTLKYYPDGTSYWAMRVDPFEVESFQLTVTFDPARAQLDTSFGINGVLPKFPFMADVTVGGPGGSLTVSGSVEVPRPGDADIFELRFIDLQPGLPIEQAVFTVLGTGTDFITAVDSANPANVITYLAPQIGATSRFATVGVSPLVWDPDGGYDNGTTGGPGVWDTSAIRWDNLPMIPVIQPPFSDVAWNNASNNHDLAVFGGIPGSGMVTLAGPIAAGGLQFDMPGYHLVGGVLTLTTPTTAIPAIDTGENFAMISSVVTGMGIRKVGSGTLTLSGPNTYAGPTFIFGGTIEIFNDGNLGAAPPAPAPFSLALAGGTLRTPASFTLNPNRGITLGALGGSFDIAGGGSVSYSGTVSGSGALIKTGPGSLSLSGAHTFTGGTMVKDGELTNNGSLASAVQILRGTFSGNGNVTAPVIIGDGLGADGTATGLPDAILSPGNSIGSMTFDALSLDSDAVFRLTLDSASATADSIILLGAGNLGNGIADLEVTDLSNGPLALNTILTIIDNVSALDTTGFFDGLPDGTTFPVGVNQFEIDYHAGLGANDVVVRVVPEPGAALLLATGVAALAGGTRRRRRT